MKPRLYPCQKLYQVEKVRPNEQMSPTFKNRDHKVINPNSRCLLQESRSFWGTPSPSTNIYIYAVVLSTTKLKIFVLIDVMSDTSNIELQFEELPCMHS